MEKVELQNIKSPDLLSFFLESYMHGDQVLDIKMSKLFCKASNSSMSNIIYREFLLGDEVTVKGKAVDHVKFFIQNYKMLSDVVRSMNNEGTLSMIVHYDKDICHKITFKNSYISFDVTSSEWGLARYIEDEKFDTIKKPHTILTTSQIPLSKVKEIKAMHSLSKSDNEKTNLVFIYQKMGKVIIEHDSIKGGWKLELDSEVTEEDFTIYAMPLEIFNNLGNRSDFNLYMAKLINGTMTCYLITNTGSEMVNISRIEKKE